MPSKRALQCIEEGLERIENIEKICADSGGVVRALENELVSQPAIMMHITIIYQQFEKLQKRNEVEILNLISKEIINNIKKSRNIAAHDYDSLIFEVVEKVIRFDLPKLKNEFEQILSHFQKKTSQEDLRKELEYYEKNKNSFYQDAKLKQERLILTLYKELKNSGEPIDEKSLKIIEAIQSNSKSR